ncbi:MAG: 1-deoxy-D-xylulose-5-phosphate reductoisomerase [Ruminococcaceae bacterium]|nr:1-deoxy-D-xylulose-5-phosphate reductoisomerase [Oscillospiraceae bacterium]
MIEGKKSIAILGSTGSVGQQAVEIVEHLNLNVDLLTASSSVDSIELQARKLKPKVCVLTNKISAKDLKTRLRDTDIKVYDEVDLNKAIEDSSAQVAINAISGFAGLSPAISAAKSGKRIAMSNKEAIVIAYKFLKDAIDKNNAELVPVDSEHSAIFQCLQGRSSNDIKRIILTSSGGPFRGKKFNELSSITAKDALAHPTWKMGAKITVDSASLMNKGFEVIEAVRLFNVSPNQVKVVVHPQSIMHSAVEYNDNSVIAQMGAPDMRTCIQYAITYPKRQNSLAKALDFAQISKLTFEEPDFQTFSLLSLAFYAIEEDGIIPAVLNASDEVAVKYFLENKIGFTDIFKIVEKIVTEYKNVKNPSLDDIIYADKEARILAHECVKSYQK